MLDHEQKPTGQGNLQAESQTMFGVLASCTRWASDGNKKGSPSGCCVDLSGEGPQPSFRAREHVPHSSVAKIAAK